MPTFLVKFDNPDSVTKKVDPLQTALTESEEFI